MKSVRNGREWPSETVTSEKMMVTMVYYGAILKGQKNIKKRKAPIQDCRPETELSPDV